MKKQLSLSLFLPAFNEEANIRPAVERAVNALQNMPSIGKYEIIIVNDGSTDRTGKIAESISHENSAVRVISHPTNLGYGQAVITGIRNAQYEYIFYTDADLQFDMYEIWKLLSYVPTYQVVIGFRKPRRDPFMRILNAKVWNMLNRVLFGLKVKDIDCAFKLFERQLVEDIPFVSSGAMLSAEMLIRLQRSGIVFKEVPVTHLPRVQGSPTGAKPSVIKKALKELFYLYTKSELGNLLHQQALRFIAVGFLNTAVDFFAYYFLSRDLIFFSDHLTVTKLVSFLSGSVCSFFFNRSWTFRKNGRIQPQEVGKFYSTVALSVIINTASMQFFISVFHIYDLIAVVLSILFTFAFNFTLSKFWVFRPQDQTGDEKRTEKSPVKTIKTQTKYIGQFGLRGDQ